MALNKHSIGGAAVYSAATGAKADVTTDTKVLIHSISCFNTTAASLYLQVFDAQSANVTLGTTTPTFVISMAALAAVGRRDVAFDPPILFTAGFTIGSTTARAGATTGVGDVTITYNSEA